MNSGRTGSLLQVVRTLVRGDCNRVAIMFSNPFQGAPGLCATMKFALIVCMVLPSTPVLGSFAMRPAIAGVNTRNSREAVATNWFGTGASCCRLPARWGQTTIVSVGGRQGCITGSTMRPTCNCAVRCGDCAVPASGNGVGYYTCSRRGGLMAPPLKCLPGTLLVAIVKI